MIKLKLLIIPALFFSLLVFSTCEFHSEEELYGLCDTSNMTYTKVKYIFENNCYTCHTTPQGNYNIKLNTYLDVKAAVNTGRLEGAINHKNGFEQMPQGQPKLSDCEIAKIEAWINAEMPE